jgi:hypothetical protein
VLVAVPLDGDTVHEHGLDVDDALVRFCRAASDADLPFTVLEVGQRWRYPAET